MQIPRIQQLRKDLPLIRALVHEALAHIKDQEKYGRGLEPAGAIWRLVDAVGLLSEAEPSAVGVECNTGRGYRLAKGEPHATLSRHP